MTEPSSRPDRATLRLGTIPGATPDKWAARWHARFPEVRLQVEHFDDAGQLERVRAGTVDVGYLRLPAGQSLAETAEDAAAFHRVLLYCEDPVVCAASDHWIAAAEESVVFEEIAEEPLLDPAEMIDPAGLDVHAPRAGAQLARAERLAMEVVASGTGLLILPRSVARALSRKDVVIRRLEDRPGYDVGLCWLRGADDDVIQEFIGVARGRRAGSDRGELGGAGGPSDGAGGSRRAEAKTSRRGGSPAGRRGSSGPGAGRGQGTSKRSSKGSGKGPPKGSGPRRGGRRRR